jgi:hypothetical protein
MCRCGSQRTLEFIDPAPGIIDGNAGPVIRNDGATRHALRRLKYVYPGATIEELTA